jgi:hypothetical protein
MENNFSAKKIPLESLLDLLIQLYESGVDFVDLNADNSDPKQDRLIITTLQGYINPEYYDEEGFSKFEQIDDEDEAPKREGPIIRTRKLSDDDIDKLL